MKTETIKCDYCKERVPEKVDYNPTWFGRYHVEKLVGVICKDCIKDKDNLEKWREGKV